MLAFGDDIREAIQAGNHKDLCHGLCCMAALWFHVAGTDIRLRNHIFAANVIDNGILAAACDLYDLLELSPQGRKALLDFCNKPVFEQTKGE